MRLSVIPSLRYSVSALPLWLVKGRTATEETSLESPVRDLQPNHPAADNPSTTAPTAAHFHGTCFAAVRSGPEAATLTFAELESLRSRFRSLSRSAAL